MLSTVEPNQSVDDAVVGLARVLLGRASEACLTFQERRRTRQRYRTLASELKQFRHGELIELGIAPADIDQFARYAIYDKGKAYRQMDSHANNNQGRARRWPAAPRRDDWRDIRWRPTEAATPRRCPSAP